MGVPTPLQKSPQKATHILRTVVLFRHFEKKVFTAQVWFSNRGLTPHNENILFSVAICAHALFTQLGII